MKEEKDKRTTVKGQKQYIKEGKPGGRKEHQNVSYESKIGRRWTRNKGKDWMELCREEKSTSVLCCRKLA